MTNYFTKQYLQQSDNNFLRNTLVPFLKRQLNQQTEHDSPPSNIPVLQLDHHTQTEQDFHIQKSKFDPVAIFYEQIQQQPSTRELVSQVRTEMQLSHSKAMQEALFSLTSQHKQTTESLQKCLMAERTARTIEKQNFMNQVEIQRHKIEDMEQQLGEKLCQHCRNDLQKQNDQLIISFENQVNDLKQINLEQTYRISELEQNMQQLLNDFQLKKIENENQYRQLIQSQEQIKLYQDLVQKLNLMQQLGSQQVNNQMTPLQLLSNVLSGAQSGSNSDASQNSGVINLQEQNKYLKNQLNQYQNQTYDTNTINLENTQKPDLVVFNKDTTPPAVPHVQYPPILQQIQQQQYLSQTDTANIQYQKDQQAAQEQIRLFKQFQLMQKQFGNLTGSAAPDDRKDPEKIDRSGPTVKQQDVQRINRIESISESENDFDDTTLDENDVDDKISVIQQDIGRERGVLEKLPNNDQNKQQQQEIKQLIQKTTNQQPLMQKNDKSPDDDFDSIHEEETTDNKKPQPNAIQLEKQQKPLENNVINNYQVKYERESLSSSNEQKQTKLKDNPFDAAFNLNSSINLPSINDAEPKPNIFNSAERSEGIRQSRASNAQQYESQQRLSRESFSKLFDTSKREDDFGW